MKTTILTIFIALIGLKTIAQNPVKQLDLSDNTELNYVFSRMNTENIQTKILYEGGLHIKLFSISDSKVTAEDFSEGTEEFLESYYISISPDGDAYTSSRLIKLEGLVFPEIISISESQFPAFSITMEQGFKGNRSQHSVLIK